MSTRREHENIALPDLNELINRRKLFRNRRTSIGSVSERRGTMRLEARTYTFSPESLHVRYVRIVIYLGDDRQNIHVKIITRRLPMVRENETLRRKLTCYPV